ncbi:MAG TPA: DUF542 domain-containing protein, partial [Ferruginibacter sp.]|nr:DUF542 domain-containing protein [Ferruginibacter sp.]
MEAIFSKSLSQIVTDNYQTAQIFENYGLDFCCKGKRSLLSACEEKQIDVDTILKDLDTVIKPGDHTSDFNEMSLTELSEYIIRVHHTYVKLNMPQIFNYILRVTTKHGDQYTFLAEVKRLFDELRKDFEEHMENE